MQRIFVSLVVGLAYQVPCRVARELPTPTNPARIFRQVQSYLHVFPVFKADWIRVLTVGVAAKSAGKVCAAAAMLHQNDV